jgi:hypothetical protein
VERRGGFARTPAKLGFDFAPVPRNDIQVKVDAARKAKSEAQLLDQATGQVLKAIKQKMLKKQGRVDYSKLRKDGYSERFLARLEEA